MNFFLVTILVSISSTLSEIRGDLFLPFPKLRSIFSKLKKRQGDGGYLEQCGIIDFGERKFGTVNVLAFFDANWQYSHRQAAMLKELKGRFERSGMVDINFFVINSTPSTIIEQGEIEIEEDTWEAISPIEAEGFPLVETSLEALNKTLGPEFHLIEDNSQLQIWKKLHVSRDQILVVDGCGKLTYQVIVPWSILHFPYVKAAILSTYKDEACGPCTTFKENIIKEVEPKEVKKEEINTDEKTTLRSEVQETTIEESEIPYGETTTPLEIEEPSAGGGTTDGITISYGIEKDTKERIKTPDGATTIQSENVKTRTEQTKLFGSVKILSEMKETTKKQVEKYSTIPSDIEEEITEEIETGNGASAGIENQEIITEQAQRDVTIIISEGKTTTEPSKTGTRTMSLEIEETTTEEMKRADHATTTHLENQEITNVQTQNYGTMTISSKIEDRITISSIQEQGTTEEMERADNTTTTTRLENPALTTEQIQNYGTVTIPSKIEESTTEELRREAITVIPSIIEEEETEEMRKGDYATTELANQAIATKLIQKDKVTTIPSKIEETTTEELRTEAVTATQSIIEGETTEGNERVDNATTTQLDNHEITTERTRRDESMTTPSKIEETTIEESKTEAVTAILSFIGEETTKGIKRGDNATTMRLEDQAITTEQTQKDSTMTIQSKIEETMTVEFNTEAVTTISSIIEEGTTEELKKAGDATTTQLENGKITTGQTRGDETITIPSKIEETATEELKTEIVTAISPDIKEETTEEMKKMNDTIIQIKNQEITTQQTDSVETTSFLSLIEEQTIEETRTEILENDDFNDKENDENSEKIRQETEQLKPTLDLENNSEELDHILSKFPNVRSISTEINRNQIGLDQNFGNWTNESAENPKDVPIRIILRAPHLDIYENSLIKHEYLILNTDDPDSHNHIDRGIKIESLEQNLDFKEGSADFENSDIWKIEKRDFLNPKEVDVKIINENETKNGLYGFHIEMDNFNDDNNENKNSEQIKKRVFGKDESPGLYGEVADYWRNDGIEIFYDEAFHNEEDDKFYDMEEDQNDEAEISNVFKSEISHNGTGEHNGSDNQKDNNVVNSISNVLEEEARSKLIAHYSKLLPWIYYVLN